LITGNAAGIRFVQNLVIWDKPAQKTGDKIQNVPTTKEEPFWRDAEKIRGKEVLGFQTVLVTNKVDMFELVDHKDDVWVQFSLSLSL